MPNTKIQSAIFYKIQQNDDEIHNKWYMYVYPCCRSRRRTTCHVVPFRVSSYVEYWWHVLRMENISSFLSCRGCSYRYGWSFNCFFFRFAPASCVFLISSQCTIISRLMYILLIMIWRVKIWYTMSTTTTMYIRII